MLTIEAFLGRLKKTKAEYPGRALSAPVRGDAFEYGHHSGVMKGLDMAEKLIEQMLEEEDIHERELEARLGR